MERTVFTSAFLTSPSLLTRTSRLLSSSHHGLLWRRPFHAEASALKSTFSGNKTDDNDVLKMFIKERQENGDFISRVSDKLWWRDSIKFVNSEDENVTDELQEEVLNDRNSGGFLKLVKTQEWIAGDSIAPVNRKLTRKERQNDSEKRRKLNFLKYEAVWYPFLVQNYSFRSIFYFYALQVKKNQKNTNAITTSNCTYFVMKFRQRNMQIDAVLKLERRYTGKGYAEREIYILRCCLYESLDFDCKCQW